MELSLNTYSECVESFIAADQLMGTAFRQLVRSINTARDFYIEQNSDSENPAWGFQTQFAADCGVQRSFVTQIDQIASDPEIVTAVTNNPDLSLRAARKLLGVDSETRAAALAELEQTGELTEPRIIEIETELSEFETAQIERERRAELESDLERRERDHQKILERIQPADSDISRFTHFLFSAGIQLDTYQQKTGEQLTAEKIASFIVDEASKSAAAYNGDPEIFADSIRDIRQVVDLFGRALELVSDRQPPTLTIIK